MNKKIAVFSLIAFCTVAMVSAGLVDYLSNTVSQDISLDSPFYIDENMGLELDILYSGDDDFSLVKITNRAERDIAGDIEISVSPDSEGVALAITEDVNYCFSSQGDMTGVADCEVDYMTWMGNNVEWNDWYATEAYDENVFFSDLVINYEDNSFHEIGYTGDDFILSGLTFPAGETVYGVVYASTNPALEPTDYSFKMTIIPTTA